MASPAAAGFLKDWSLWAQPVDDPARRGRAFSRNWVEALPGRHVDLEEQVQGAESDRFSDWQLPRALRHGYPR